MDTEEFEINEYKEEIIGINRMIQEDEKCQGVRDFFVEHDFKLNEIVVVAFFDDEEEMEYGVFVRKDLRVFSYARSTAEDMKGFEVVDINDITEDEAELDDFPWVYVAMEMIKNGELL